LLSIQLKAEEARREKLLQLILSILDVEPSMLSDFNESAKRELGFIEMIMNRSAIDDYSQMLVKIFRAVHLVKGNARLLKIDYFGEQAHQFEDMIAAVQKKSQITDKDINPLRQKLRELQAGIEEMEKIIEKLGQVVIRKDRKGKTDTRSLFQSLENLINSFSSDLGKKIKFDYKKFKSNIIPEKYHLLVKEVLIQLVRNSISHGIEQPEERRRLKKPKIGTIEISTFTRNGSVGFRYRDDGRGLQIEKLKERAIQSGKWQKEVINSWNEQQVADLIFASGITTSDKVDMIAGRGVGMDSVRYRIEEHQGEIRVYHAEGKYCEFEVTLPVT
jgi:chemotaxis protein histidine kinase CheA